MENSPTPIVSNKGPLPDEVLTGLKDNADPLEFIRQNLKQSQAAGVPESGTVVQPAPAAAPPPPENPVATPSFKDGDLSLPLELPSDPKTPDPAPPSDPIEALGDRQTTESGEPPAQIAKGPQESLKDLRKRSNEFKSQLEESTAQNAQLQADLEKYKTGEAMPEVIRQKEQRIAELEQYEQLHALRLSPEYNKRYVEPLTELKAKAVTLAEEYNVDPDVLNQALEVEGKRELNAFLKGHFDDVGALEVRELLTKIKTLDTEAHEAELQPAEAFEKIRSEYTKQERVRETERVTNLTNNSRSGWIEALTELRSDGEYPELVLRANDEEHNKFARPLLESAAQEYAKFVRLLGVNGTKDLPQEAAKILAKRYLLSQITPLTAHSRAEHHRRAESVIAEGNRMAAFTRPSLGSGAVSAPVARQRTNSPEEAADILIEKVLRKA